MICQVRHDLFRKGTMLNTHFFLSTIKDVYITFKFRRASSFGCVVSRKWRRLEAGQPLKMKLPGYQHLPAFVFDSPSPDDIVKSAQAQSRAFRPPTTAS